MSKVLTLALKRPARMSSNLRTALQALATKDLYVTAAFALAGISRQGFHKAMKRPGLREYLETARLRLVMQAEDLRAYAQARAIGLGLDLMINSTNESIRVRLEEFFGSDPKVSPVAVHVDARQTQGAPSYTYKRPDSEGESE